MATYSLNYEQNGVEIYFDTKPNSTVLEDLKRNGWHWNGKKKVWYKKQSADSIAFAKKLCNRNDVKTIPVNTVSFNFTDYFSKRHDVTVEKTKTGYSITSTTNMILCVDCNKIYSIHASACPFCGCPLHYTADNYYKRFIVQQVLYRPESTEFNSRFEQLDKKVDKAKQIAQQIQEEKERKEREEHYKKERDRIQAKIERDNLRRKELDETFKDFNLDKAKQKILIESDIDASELYSRLFRLKSAYGSVNGKIFEIVTKSKKVFEERLSFYKNSSNIAKENIKICTGNCSMCEREKCVKDI